MNSGINFIFDNFSTKKNELKEVFEFFNNNQESLKFITIVLERIIMSRGQALAENKELFKSSDSKTNLLIIEFIAKLIELQKEIDELIEQSFYNHIQFQDTRAKAFAALMNSDSYAIHLANFTEYEFKKGLKGLKEDKIEERLNDVMNLFKCIHNRLRFQLEYCVNYIYLTSK